MLTAKFLSKKATIVYKVNCLYDQPCPDNPHDNIFSEHVSDWSGVTVEQRSQLVEVLENFWSIFDTRPGLNKLNICRFDVSADKPFEIHPYLVPFTKCPAVENEIKRMLIRGGVIECYSLPYSNPILCVSKGDGTVRLCLDARRINRVILPMRDSSPPLDELLTHFGGKSLQAWILQPAIGKCHYTDVRKFTAFTYDGRTYRFCVVPFGLNISNVAFGLALEAVLNVPVDNIYDQLRDLHIYVDELLISSTTIPEHLSQLTTHKDVSEN